MMENKKKRKAEEYRMEKEITIKVPEATLRTIKKAAEKKNVETENAIRLILNEWAMRERIANSIAEMKKDR